MNLAVKPNYNYPTRTPKLTLSGDPHFEENEA